MTNVSAGSLKGRYMKEIYEVVCRYPQGVIASEVKRECPTIPPGRVGSTLRKLKELGLIRAEHYDTSTVIHRWVKNRGGEEDDRIGSVLSGAEEGHHASQHAGGLCLWTRDG